MTRDEAIWWVNHLFEIRKEEYFNKGMMKDAKEVEEAQYMAIEALSEPSEQVTGKLKKPCDSLLTDDSAECKEQKSKLDLISRADAIDAVVSWTVEDKPTEEMPTDLVDRINALPSADRPMWKWIGEFIGDMQEKAIALLRMTGWLDEHDKEIGRPHGEWVDFVSQVEGRFKECGRCGERIYLSTFYENDYNYCPTCGAKMGGESDG